MPHGPGTDDRHLVETFLHFFPPYQRRTRWT
jgi:hypothetical protein